MRIGENHPANGARAPVDRHDWETATYHLGAHAAAGAGGAWTFALYSKHAERVLLELYDESLGRAAACDYWLTKGSHDVWRAKIAGVTAGTFYGFRCWGPNFAWDERWRRGNTAAGFLADVDSAGNRFNPNKLLLDPYARELSHDREKSAMVAAGHNGAMYMSGPRQYAGVASREFDTGPWAPKSITVPDEAAAANGRPTFRQKDAVIYEVHVRGLTEHPSASEIRSLLRGVPGCEGVANVPEDERGTYAGAGRMAPYLKALGVNTVELLPVHECNNDLNSADTSDHAADTGADCARGDAESALGGVVVDGEMLVGEEERKRVPLTERVADGLADGALRWMPRLLGVEPSLEAVHGGPALRLPHLEMLGGAQQVGIKRGALDLVDVEDEAHRLLCRFRRAGLRLEESTSKMRQAAGALAAAG